MNISPTGTKALIDHINSLVNSATNEQRVLSLKPLLDVAFCANKEEIVAAYNKALETAKAADAAAKGSVLTPEIEAAMMKHLETLDGTNGLLELESFQSLLDRFSRDKERLAQLLAGKMERELFLE